MNGQKMVPADGRYECAATVHIQDGKAVVVLHDAFGLEPGASVPLLRQAEGLRVVSVPGGRAVVLDGQAII